MPRPLLDSQYLYGLHDPGGEQIMLDMGITGWVLVTEAIGYQATDQRGGDYRYLSDRGLGVLVRLNAGYGGVGTIPYERYYGAFAQRCANYVRNSQGAHIWIIGNEMNHPIEWPGADWDWNAVRPKSPDKKGEMITPQRYVACYSQVRAAIHAISGHENDQVLVGAVAPWNPLTQYPGNENGDWIKYFVDILTMLGRDGCDGIAIHTYTHGTDPDLIDSEARMESFPNRRYHFRAYQDFMQAIPWNMRDLPVYITETDQDEPWRNENTGWVRRAYGEIDYWNKIHPDQPIRALILYRWPKHDKWFIDGKQGVIEDFKQAMRYRYQWKPAVSVIDWQHAYRARIVLLDTFPQLSPGSTFQLAVSCRNVGNDTWPSGGSNPVRLGYHWYNAQGQRVTTPDHRTSLPNDVSPGNEARVRATIAAPAQAGEYTLVLDMVHEGITWFADRGSQLTKTTVSIAGTTTPSEKYFSETKVWVRGPFLAFYQQYGLDICGYPITEAFYEDGVLVQYFQRVALEEYQPGKVRLRLTAQQAYEAKERIKALERRIALLQRRLEGGVGAAPQPDITDITDQLPRDPSRMVTRAESEIEYIVINHTAVRPEVSVERIAQAHRQRWPAIVCQFYIQGDGSILQTNPLTEVVDGQQDWIRKGVNIHVAGNFTDAVPTQAQIDSLAALCAWLLDRYSLDTEAVKGAKEFIVTQSPGKQWLEGQRWKDMLVSAIEPLRGTGSPGETPSVGDSDLAQEVAELKKERDDLTLALNAANTEIASLQSRIRQLETQLREGGGPVQPVVTDIIDKLPRDADKMIKRQNKDIKYIVINHTAVPANVSVERVAKAHHARWPAIVCQFYVEGDGSILQTNPINEVVDDKYKWFLNGINIHVAGNFNEEIPNEAQLSSLANLVAWLLETYKLKVSAIKGMQEFIITQSPGRQWLTGKKWKNTLIDRVEKIQKSAPSRPGTGSSADAALTARIKALEKQVSDLQAENDSNLAQLQQASAQIEQLQADIDARDKQIGQLNQTNRALNAEKQRLNRTISTLQQQIEQLKKEKPSTESPSSGEVVVGVSKPPMVELVDVLPKHPTKRYESRTLDQITHLAIHHSAAPANVTPERIAKYHVESESHQWPGIGYHFYIQPDGTINHTQDMKLISYHVYSNNEYTVGICVAGNFTDVIPTPAQIDATAHLAAWLMQELNISLSNVMGHKEYPKNVTACPGRQWLEDQNWKDLLVGRIQALQQGATPITDKPIDHYVLFWQHPNDWAKQDWLGAINYIARFRPTTGFSVDDAKNARRVTIIGGIAGVSQQAEDSLRQAGCLVERIAGRDYEETKTILDQLAESGRRFINL
ncbi:MAG: hypothetical protein GXP38_07220 [Chloroflexi bacterium]|nr:hypothetical protein [Chloroflexota bacterium]